MACIFDALWVGRERFGENRYRIIFPLLNLDCCAQPDDTCGGESSAFYKLLDSNTPAPITTTFLPLLSDMFAIEGGVSDDLLGQRYRSLTGRG